MTGSTSDTCTRVSVVENPRVPCQVRWRTTWDWQRVVISASFVSISCPTVWIRGSFVSSLSSTDTYSYRALVCRKIRFGPMNLDDNSPTWDSAVSSTLFYVSVDFRRCASYGFASSTSSTLSGRAIPKMFPSVCREVHPRMSASSIRAWIPWMAPGGRS